MYAKLASLFSVFALVACVLFAVSQPAHAYLDPGTGSYAAQIAIAGALGMLFSMKSVLRRFASRMTRRPRNVAAPKASESGH